MFTTLTIVMISGVVSAEKGYMLELNSLDGAITFSQVRVTETTIPTESTQENAFSAELIDVAGNQIYKTSFNPIAYGPFTIVLPYLKNIKEIIIRDPSGSEQLRIPVLQFADTCKNSVCDPQESYETCPEDCPSGGSDDYCDERDDNWCDPDCPKEADPDCRTEVTAQKQPEEVIRGEIAREETEENAVPIAQKELDIKFIGTISMGVIVTLVVSFFIAREIKAKSARTAQLREYISQCLRQGYRITQIRQVLLHQGYEQKEIERVIMVIYKRR